MASIMEEKMEKLAMECLLVGFWDELEKIAGILTPQEQTEAMRALTGGRVPDLPPHKMNALPKLKKDLFSTRAPIESPRGILQMGIRPTKDRLRLNRLIKEFETRRMDPARYATNIHGQERWTGHAKTLDEFIEGRREGKALLKNMESELAPKALRYATPFRAFLYRMAKKGIKA